MTPEQPAFVYFRSGKSLKPLTANSSSKKKPERRACPGGQVPVTNATAEG